MFFNMHKVLKYSIQYIFGNGKKIWNKNYKQEVLSKCKDSHTLQIWNQFLNREGIDKNKLPKGSAIEYFYNKFVKD